MPRLIVVPTPIGNLEDITLRALKELAAASLILAEDTRHTRRLLSHYQISGRLLSYHQHNKVARLETALQALQSGSVALVSNAGTPSISDPGFELVEAAVAAGVEVDVLPGASAVITAVVGAAIPAPGFLFFGFLPRQSGGRRSKLRELKDVQQALVFYEAPHRLLGTLRDMQDALGDRPAVVARELTKLHQEWIRGTIATIHERFADVEPRGELTIVLAGAERSAAPDSTGALEFMRARRAERETRREAIEGAVQLFGVTRNDAYRLWLMLDSGSPPDRLETE